jgi:hypothetical protein
VKVARGSEEHPTLATEMQKQIKDERNQDLYDLQIRLVMNDFLAGSRRSFRRRRGCDCQDLDFAGYLGDVGSRSPT